MNPVENAIRPFLTVDDAADVLTPGMLDVEAADADGCMAASPADGTTSAHIAKLNPTALTR